MRTSWRLAVPLLLGLCGLAWGATAAMTKATRAWFMRDVEARAHLAAVGAQGALAGHLRKRDGRKLSALLEGLGRDERILAAAACTPLLATAGRTSGFPERFTCEALRSRLPGPEVHPLALSDELDGESAHVSVHPLEEDGTIRGALVLVQDVTFIGRRELAVRHFVLSAFAFVAVLGAILEFAGRRSWWRSWTHELRRVLFLSRGERGGGPRADHAFRPLLADVTRLVSELASERAVAAPAADSAERLQHVLHDALKGESIVLLANREPYLHDRDPDGRIRVRHPASGLVSALEPVMRACSGTWVAHGSGSADRETVDASDRIRVPPGEHSYAIRRVWLTEEEEQGYYYGFANEGLWALCHVAHTRPEFRASDWRQYVRVNQRFADAVCEEVEGPDPVVLVQDYHFALAPRMIRERLPRATLIGFWHIPWPNAERFGICPWERELLEGLLGSSIVGFHTQQHCNNFVDAVDRYLEARIDRERQAIVQGGHECLVRAYPISVEWPSRWAAASPPAAECRAAVLAELGLGPDALLGVGVDRLDYTKGIEERLLAVERALERWPSLRGRFTFVQLAAPSRTLIESYRALDRRVVALVARIQARFGAGSYRPCVLLRGHHEPPTVFRYLRAADVCYVSSLHDGMNLVAKEFVSARDDLRGVLVLSRFTGAARELTEALVVNPYDLEQASAALFAALAMPAGQQEERMRAMRRRVAEFNVYRWAGTMLADAARLRQQLRLSDRLAPGPRPPEAEPAASAPARQLGRAG